MNEGGLESSVNAVPNGDCGGGKGGAVSFDEEATFSVANLLRLGLGRGERRGGESPPFDSHSLIYPTGTMLSRGPA